MTAVIVDAAVVGVSFMAAMTGIGAVHRWWYR